MKSKKVLSLILALLLTVTSIPAFMISVSAEGEDVWSVNGTGYSTWDAAYEAASNGDTITLLQDITSWTTAKTVEKKITIDGGGKSLTSTATYIWEFKTDGAVQNFKEIHSAQGIKFHATNGVDSAFTIQNIEKWTASKVVCNIVSTSSETTPKQTVTIKNTIIYSTANEPVVMTYNYCPATIDLDNTVINYSGAATSNYPHMSAIRVRYNTETEINLKNASKVIYAPAISATNVTFNVVNVYASENVKLNLESGVEIKLSAENIKDGASISKSYFISGKACTVNDAGASWVVDSSITSYQFAETNPTGVVALINTSTKALSAPTETLTSNGTFKTLCLSNEEGASVRTAGPIGIRFTANSNSVFADSTLFANATVTFGHIITTKDILNSDNVAGDFSKLTAENSVRSTVTTWTNTEKTNYRTAMIDIPETAEAMQTEFAATAYVTITMGSNSVTYYAAYQETNNCRSIYAVAKAAVETEAYRDNATLNAIVVLCEPVTQAIAFTAKAPAGQYEVGDNTVQLLYTDFTASDLAAYEENVKKNSVNL